MAGTHSPLSPSGAHRYLRCTAAPLAEEGLPNWESVYAFEGTVLHEIAERCLTDGGDPHRFIGESFTSDPAENETGQPFVVTIDKDHADCMVSDLTVVRDLAEGGEIFLETRGDLTWPLGEGEAGTSDIALRAEDGSIHIMDWKFGAGIVVSAFENEQLMLYAVGSIVKHWPHLLTGDEKGNTTYVDEYENLPIHLHILQPRATGGGDHWETTLSQLVEWSEWVRVIVGTQIYGPDRKFSPSEKACQWCAARNPVNGVVPCTAYVEKNLKVAQELLPALDDFVEMGLPATADMSPHGMDIEKAIWILDNAPMFKKWLDEIHQRVYKDLADGRPVPGKKLITGRKTARRFKAGSGEAVAEILSGLESYETTVVKVKSPTQLEKSLPSGVYDLTLAHLVEQGEGKAIIVDEDNPKPAIKSNTDFLTAID